MSLRGLSRRQRNVYGFSTKRIPKSTLSAILETATHVPSAGFTQDYDFVVVSDGRLKAELGAAASEDGYVGTGYAKRNFISSAPVIIVPCANKSKLETKYGKPAEENARLPWWLIDAGFASFALVLSAFEKGLGASFIGAFDDNDVSKVLKLPADRSVVLLALVPIGYKSRDETKKWRTANREAIKGRRLRLDELVHWNVW